MDRVLVFGTFDGLHPGHVYFLEQAQKRGALHVVVAHDGTVLKIKHHLPQRTQKERCDAIQREFPDAVIIRGGTRGYLMPVRRVVPDVICLGYDQSLPPGVAAGMIPCPVERLLPLQPERYKSSIRRGSHSAVHCKNRAGKV